GTRLYRTGDIGCLNEAGEILFFGRKDHQVKLRGHRIELSEIEEHLSAQTGVAQCAVVIQGGEHLLAFVEPQEGQRLDSSQLMQSLSSSLPKYMLPSHIIVQTALPLTNSGKINRQQLATQKVARHIIAHEDPKTAKESAMQFLWKQVLDIKEASVTADFFDLGGHSLKAIRLLSMIRDEYNVELSFQDFNEHSTIRTLCAFLSKEALAASISIPKAAQADTYELSSAQQRLWLTYKFDSSQTVYNVPAAIRIKGHLDRNALESSLDFLCQRHESLRTRFVVVQGEARQQILDAKEGCADLQWEDISGESELEALCIQKVSEALETPFDLEAGPLFRVYVWQTASDEYIFLFNLHHIISDAWSIDVLLQEWAMAYESFSNGQRPQLAELPIQYKDFAAWSNESLQQADMQKHRSYWHRQLAGSIPSLDLPTDFARPEQVDFEGRTLHCRIPAPLQQQMENLAADQKASLFAALTASIQTLLYRLSGQSDVVLGTTVASRVRRELLGQIGFYVNMLPLRTQLSTDKGFLKLLQKVQQSVTDAFDHQEYPFGQLLDELSIERTTNRHPLFDVLVELLEEEGSQESLESKTGLTFSDIELANHTSKFDLSFLFRKKDGRLYLQIEYRTSLFSESSIDRLKEQYLELLKNILTDPDRPLDKLSYHSRQEQESILRWSRPSSDAKPFQSLSSLFETTVAEWGEETALQFGAESITYKELNERANAMAHQLIQENQVGPGSLLAIYTDRSIELIVSMLACLKSGAAYLPIDPAYPLERVQYLVEDSKADLLLTDSRRIFDLSVQFGEKLFLLDAISESRTDNPEIDVQAEQLAYVLYTSGSTGMPKGVEITQSNISHYIRWANAFYF
ncbi:MAG: condensation domain-containing protein, partial [Bacteroidota bacterium]